MVKRVEHRSGPSVSTGGFVLLGLLLDGPRSGYELVQIVERSVGHFWPITKAHVYAELPKLAAAGLAVGRRVEQEGVPDKVLFEATSAGRDAFLGWIGEADLGSPKLHHPLLLKLFFAEHMGAAALAATLDEREREIRQTLAEYELRLAQSSSQGAPRKLTLRFGVLRLQTELAFIEEARSAIAARPKRPAAARRR